MDLIAKTKLLADLIAQKKYLAAFFLACEILAAFKALAEQKPVVMMAAGPLPGGLTALGVYLGEQARAIEGRGGHTPEDLQHLVPAYREALAELHLAA